MPFKTVGVQGDSRTYNYAVGLSGKPNWHDLMDLAKKIPQHFHNINRVVYIFGEQITGAVKTITPTKLTPDAITQLQKADSIITKTLKEYDVINLSQVPVILFPVSFDDACKRSVAIRPFITNDFMTGLPATPGDDIPTECLDKIIKDILDDSAISRVVYDLTPKPPGTVEWE